MRNLFIWNAALWILLCEFAVRKSRLRGKIFQGRWWWKLFLRNKRIKRSKKSTERGILNLCITRWWFCACCPAAKACWVGPGLVWPSVAPPPTHSSSERLSGARHVCPPQLITNALYRRATRCTKPFNLHLRSSRNYLATNRNSNYPVSDLAQS